MGDYERNQKYLQSLWNDVLSDEEPEPFPADSSDSYVPSSSENDNSSDEFESSQPAIKRRKVLPDSSDNPQPSTSRGNCCFCIFSFCNLRIP